MLTLPAAYIVLKLGGNPESVFATELCVCSAAFMVRLYIVRPLIGLSVRKYFLHVILPCTAVAILSTVIPATIRIFCPVSTWSAILDCVTGVLSVIASAYLIGLTGSEKSFIKSKIKTFFHRSGR